MIPQESKRKTTSNPSREGKKTCQIALLCLLKDFPNKAERLRVKEGCTKTIERRHSSNCCFSSWVSFQSSFDFTAEKKTHKFYIYRANNHVRPLPQYFEYTSQKEIRFNSVTELCAEVIEGQTSIGMRHCPNDGDVKPRGIVWEFKKVGTRHTYPLPLILHSYL